jgi:hypothetical protein
MTCRERRLRISSGTRAVSLDEGEEPVALSAVEPDDGGEVVHLLGGEIVDLAGDFAVDATGVEHQHLVAALPGFCAVEEPELARDASGVKEVIGDGDHHVHAAGFDDFAADLLFPRVRRCWPGRT